MPTSIHDPGIADPEPQISQMSDATRGRAAARTLWEEGLKAGAIDDPLTIEFSRAALAEFEQLQKGTPGALRQVLEGAQISAEQLNVEPFHGLNEIIQNADDSHASEVRVAIRKSAKQRHLLVAHNGDRVHLSHVIAMTLAFVSTKRDDPHSKGRFGIGLKTLGRLGDILTVHCAPYDFCIEGNHVQAGRGIKQIPGFYDPASTDTLFDLHLRDSLEVGEFQRWFSELGAESLIFLETVRTLKLMGIGDSKPLINHELSHVSRKTVTLPGLRESCEISELRDRKTKRGWERYEINRIIPPHLVRRYKARAKTTPLAISFSSNQEDTSQLYAGLPLHITTNLPFSMNAQFDPDVARKGIQHESFDRWLFEQLAELTSSVAQYKFLQEPSAAWRAVPLKTEHSVAADAWVGSRIADLIDNIQSKVRKRLRVVIEGEERRLNNLAYEVESLEGLLTASDVRGLRSQLTFLPHDARDANGRWRRVLGELGRATAIDVVEAIRLLDWEDGDLGHRDVPWFISLVRAAIDADLGTTVWKQRCIIAANGARIIPPMPDDEGELLLRRDHPESLASRLGLVHVIHAEYLLDDIDAVTVRKWLEDHDMLRETADAEASLRALAAHDWQDNLPQVGDEELRLIRDALASVSSELQNELGRGVGEVIRVEVQRWASLKRISAKRHPQSPTCPLRLKIAKMVGVKQRDGRKI